MRLDKFWMAKRRLQPHIVCHRKVKFSCRNCTNGRCSLWSHIQIISFPFYPFHVREVHTLSLSSRFYVSMIRYWALKAKWRARAACNPIIIFTPIFSPFSAEMKDQTSDLPFNSNPTFAVARNANHFDNLFDLFDCNNWKMVGTFIIMITIVVVVGLRAIGIGEEQSISVSARRNRILSNTVSIGKQPTSSMDIVF